MSKLDTINLIERDSAGIFALHVYPNTHEGRVDAAIKFHELVGDYCLKHELIALTPPQIYDFWKNREYYGIDSYSLLVIYSNTNE